MSTRRPQKHGAPADAAGGGAATRTETRTASPPSVHDLTSSTGRSCACWVSASKSAVRWPTTSASTTSR